MKWKLWYDDWSTFSSEDGEAWESPPDGVVLVTQDVPGHREEVLAYGQPWYIHRTDLDCWFNCEPHGFADQMKNFAHVIDCVRLGRWAPTREFWKEVQRVAGEDLRGHP